MTVPSENDAYSLYRSRVEVLQHHLKALSNAMHWYPRQVLDCQVVLAPAQNEQLEDAQPGCAPAPWRLLSQRARACRSRYRACRSAAVSALPRRGRPRGGAMTAQVWLRMLSFATRSCSS